ncbi:unnamed protein product [Symbiodinium pilosum]|uniref:Uncharacterized protein n=1 Tax=Symbiodinium pilosum TaxID=2952 RepID=A0A812K1K1_SYMPI|nr:unnamed protein product [Symbiodinium pilosum]
MGRMRRRPPAHDRNFSWKVIISTRGIASGQRGLKTLHALHVDDDVAGRKHMPSLQHTRMRHPPLLAAICEDSMLSLVPACSGATSGSKGTNVVTDLPLSPPTMFT